MAFSLVSNDIKTVTPVLICRLKKYTYILTKIFLCLKPQFLFPLDCLGSVWFLMGALQSQCHKGETVFALLPHNKKGHVIMNYLEFSCSPCAVLSGFWGRPSLSIASLVFMVCFVWILPGFCDLFLDWSYEVPDQPILCNEHIPPFLRALTEPTQSQFWLTKSIQSWLEVRYEIGLQSQWPSL